ncbi:MAG: class I SAM-dependent methyltransferase [Rhizobiaceae bacterium]|nr:class I SAM-dependent methyltransferase [Rhizobiaceae bacterium]
MTDQHTDATPRTITDFGDQWQRFRDNDGYYASNEMFADIVAPFLTPADFENSKVAELGSGSGRIVGMLLKAGASHVTAVEPSDAFYVLEENLGKAEGEQVTLIHDTAERLPEGEYDFVLSIGVIHHIPEPDPAIARAFGCLKKGGRVLIWLYGKEGNSAYLSVVLPLRKITSRLPDWTLMALSHILTAFLSVYAALCHVFPLPMRKYMRDVISRYPWRHRMLTVFDQLNPEYAKYYARQEAEALLERAGFADVQSFNRHGYSWLVTGTKA